MKTMRICILILLSLSLYTGALAQKQSPPVNDAFKTAKGIVGELYKSISFAPGESPDWERVKSCFINEAVIVLRIAGDKMMVISKDGLIKLLIDDIKENNLGKSGFAEKPVSVKLKEYGGIAHCFVVYDTIIPGDTEPPLRGVDSFHLIKKDGRWWIVSITNEKPGPGNPIPKEFLK